MDVSRISERKKLHLRNTQFANTNAFRIFVPFQQWNDIFINERRFALSLSLKFAKILQSQGYATTPASMLYTYLTDSLYIVWCGQLLCICDWGVWRYLETDMRIVLTPFYFVTATAGNRLQKRYRTMRNFHFTYSNVAYGYKKRHIRHFYGKKFAEM